VDDILDCSLRRYGEIDTMIEWIEIVADDCCEEEEEEEEEEEDSDESVINPSRV
jgi:hypothetical protein